VDAKKNRTGSREVEIVDLGSRGARVIVEGDKIASGRVVVVLGASFVDV
jgi:hypothetical protein